MVISYDVKMCYKIVTYFLARQPLFLLMKTDSQFEFGIVFDFRPYRRSPVAFKIAAHDEGIS